MTRFPRGSEWRKWDLHLHAPEGRQSDGYKPADWDRYCQILENSDVAAFGITDYFCFDGYRKTLSKHRDLYPESEKFFLPNLELRLIDVVNRGNDNVDIHLIFNPSIPDATLDSFLATLQTEVTNVRNRKLKCSELDSSQVESATVTRDNLVSALDDTFGRSWGPDDLILLVPASNNGIRAESGIRRKENIADQIDKLTDAIFGSSRNVEYFWSDDRYADQDQPSSPKPVFAGSDAHSFEQLERWLGRESTDEDSRKEVTWIKADLTFEGLLQTLIEPQERVRIQTPKPDQKDPYRHIESVQFLGDDGFPSDPIPLNPNLVSIIGSRSSGKSALLAYIAHAIDPDYTEAQQRATNPDASPGPAAGLEWSAVEHIQCQVAWADPEAHVGRVVYIPQNSLFSVSERPKEITAKIQPTLNRHDPTFEVAYDRMRNEVDNANAAITRHVEQWFLLTSQIRAERRELSDFGDPDGIRSTSTQLLLRIAELRQAAALSDDDIRDYQGVVDQLAELNDRLAKTDADIALCNPLVTELGDRRYEATEEVDVSIVRLPAAAVLPAELADQLDQRISAVAGELTDEIRQSLAEFRATLDVRRSGLVAAINQLESQNHELIARNRANVELEDAVRQHQRHEDRLRRHTEKVDLILDLEDQRQEHAAAILMQVDSRRASIDSLRATFESVPRELDEMSFGIEAKMLPDRLNAVSSPFNRQENTRYFDRNRGELIELSQVLADPGAFLAALADGDQKIKTGEEPKDVASDVLTVTESVAFFATLEGDRIGGFEPSSMTPGKQALFALTLIMNESDEEWPLLIDQPEDDLDSRSIFHTIVPYLMNRKRGRQILMVSHDANLVVGADSEQVVIANRHGEDRKNRNDQKFAYLTGSLEWTLEKHETDYILESCGVREHACDILDGGEDAFEKRRSKYHM